MKTMKKGILSSAVLKNIAYITMFIDHFFAVVYYTLVQRLQTAGYAAGNAQEVYLAGRAVGRVSFILFAYLAVEGFLHTKSRRAYLFRLGAFAFVSEIPFDLAFSEQCINWKSQNIFFTLFLGILVLTIWEWTDRKRRACASERIRDSASRLPADLYRGGMGCIMKAILPGIAAASLLLSCFVAYAFRTDYRFMGVLLIFAFYLTREKSLPVQIVAAGFAMLFGTWGGNCLRYADSYSLAYLFRFSMREMYGLFAFLPIALYNGQKGRQLPKAVCYGFYPVHLLLLHYAALMISGGAYWSLFMTGAGFRP